MSAERLEDLEHPLIARPRSSLERIADRMRQVVVADRNRVRIAERDHRNLGRGPRSDAWEGLHPPVCARQVHRHDFLQALGAARRADDDLGPATLDPKAVEGPVRSTGERLGRRRQLERKRPGGRLTERVDQVAVRLSRFLAGDLLSQNRRHQPFKHRMRTRHADARDLASEASHQRMVGCESGVIVVCSAHGGTVSHGPLRPRSPGFRDHGPVLPVEMDRRRAGGRARGKADTAVSTTYPGPIPQQREGEAEVEGAGELEASLHFRRQHADELTGSGARKT